MRTVEEHLERVLTLASPLTPRVTPIGDGAGGVLAEALYARLAVPPFDNSSMDGFAVRAADLAPSVTLRVVGDIPAGATAVPSIGLGECARIMTGAPVPPGADAVVPVEQTDQPMGAVGAPQRIVVHEAVAEGRFIRRAGENVRVGEPGLPAGLPWSPAAASSAASLGYAEVPLIPRPRVAVLSTGSELVNPGEPLGFGQIPDSNSVLLEGLCRQFGAEVVLARAVPDDRDLFRAALGEALAADLVVTTGGVSVGAFEVVRQVTDGELEFERVAMQPGKPQASGVLRSGDGRDVAMLGLPGNPVSAFVSAWVFVRPIIAKLAGRPSAWASSTATAGEGWSTPPGRRQYVPVSIADGVATPVHRLGSGSHLVASLPLADALAVVPAEVERVEAGETLLVHYVSSYFP